MIFQPASNPRFGDFQPSAKVVSNPPSNPLPSPVCVYPHTPIALRLPLAAWARAKGKSEIPPRWPGKAVRHEQGTTPLLGRQGTRAGPPGGCLQFLWRQGRAAAAGQAAKRHGSPAA